MIGPWASLWRRFLGLMVDVGDTSQLWWYNPWRVDLGCTIKQAGKPWGANQ